MNAENYDQKIEVIKQSIRTIVQSTDIIADVIYAMVENTDSVLAWYATLYRQCRIEYDETLDCPAAVYYSQNRGRFVILFNRFLCAALSNQQIAAILKHEFGHVFLMHFEREISDDYGLNVKSAHEEYLRNMAMDYTINGDRYKPLIDHIPGSYWTFIDGEIPPISAVFWSDMKEYLGIDYDVSGRETYADFYKILHAYMPESNCRVRQVCCDLATFIDGLMKKASNCSRRNKQNGCKNCIDGIGCKNGSDNEDLLTQSVEIMTGNRPLGNNHNRIIEEEKKEKIPSSDNKKFLDDKYKEFKRMVEEATQTRGFMPSDTERYMITINKRMKFVDWKKALRKSLVKSLHSHHLEGSYQRQNRILPDDPNVPGVKRKQKPLIGVVVDVSGSVSDRMIAQTLNEIVRLSKIMGASIEMVQVDTEVKKIEKVKKSMKSFTRKGCGGTIIEPGFSYFAKRPFDLAPSVIVCITDGYIETEFENVIIPKAIDTLFLIHEGGKLSFDCSTLRGRCRSIIIRHEKGE